jgi:peptidyl-dipeptidase Dcp
MPAFEKGMSEARKEVDAIADNPAAPTFENTIVAMERSGQLLNRVSTVFFSLAGANTNDTMEQISSDIAPKLSAHSDAITLNGKLFARIKSLYDRRASLGLDPQSLRLLERYHTDFVRAGANLSDADKETLKKLNSQLAELSTTFGQNVLKEVNDSGVVVDTREELAGMTEPAIAAAAKAAQDAIDEAAKALADAKDPEAKAAAEKAVARAATYTGKYLLKLLNTSGQPALDSLDNRAVRERLMKASLARGSRGNEFDNTKVVTDIARLRAERAQLLGYPDHATYVLEDETALTPEAVNKMMAGLAPAAVANARREAAEIQKVIDAEGGKFTVQPWDWAYYAEKVRAAKYNFDESQLKPYFEMKHVLEDGVFYAAHELYGISFKQRTDLPVYNPDVLVYEVTDNDGKPLALFLVDWYARSNK